MFVEQHGERIGFFPAGTGRHPDADRFLAAILDQRSDDLFFDFRPDFRVAEEAGDIDQHIVGQLAKLIGIGPQVREIVAKFAEPQQVHAPPDPPPDRAGLVGGEVVFQAGLDQGEDALQVGFGKGAVLD